MNLAELQEGPEEVTEFLDALEAKDRSKKVLDFLQGGHDGSASWMDLVDAAKEYLMACAKVRRLTRVEETLRRIEDIDEPLGYEAASISDTDMDIYCDNKERGRNVKGTI